MMYKFYNKDCMIDMVNFKDNEFDLAIVDPPYCVGAANGKFGRRKNSTKNYSMKTYYNLLPDENYFKELFRISKNQIIWGANYYPQYLNHSGWIIWDKQNEYNEQLSDCELAYHSINKRVNICRIKWSGFVKDRNSFSQSEFPQTIHPNQKPLVLYRWLLQNYARPGDTILDTHVGSGSSIIACLEEGFDITGYEIDKDYYDSAIKRIEIYQAQTKLDLEPIGG